MKQILMEMSTDELLSKGWHPVDAGRNFWFDPDSNTPRINAIINWCITYEGFGAFYKPPVWPMFYFERAEDMVMYRLRWDGSDG